jgi:hypothetical protein
MWGQKMDLRRFFRCFLLFVIFPGAVVAGEDCVQAQQIIAGTGLAARLDIYTDFDEFVKSKALDDPLTVAQFSSNPLPGDGGPDTVLSCKMKTAERINTAHQAQSAPAPLALGDTSCQLIHQTWLREIVQRIPSGQLALSPEEFVVDDEQLTFIGPMWLRPWPFEALYRGEDGLLHIRSRALYVPFAWWIPMPDRFKGTYYCHLISPVYLEALLRGEVEPDL